MKLRQQLLCCTTALLVLFMSANAGEIKKGELIFEDDFERNESQENKDEIGKD